MSSKPPRHRLIPFPAFSYVFVQRGVNHTRTLAAWTLLQKTRLEMLSRRRAVIIICRRTGLSPKQARVILRKGDQVFWDLVDGWIYPYTPARVGRSVRQLTRVVKRSKMYVPEQALRNLGQLRAHLSLAVMSRSPGLPTPRAYTAKCLSRRVNTVSIYRSWLREAGFITTTSIYRRIRLATREDKPQDVLKLGPSSRVRLRVLPLGGGYFLSSNRRWILKREPDIVELNPANIFRVDRELRSSEGILGLTGFKYKQILELTSLKYKQAILPAPVCLPRPPPGRSRADREWARALRQENRIIVPRLPLLSRAESVIMAPARGE